MKNLLRKLFFWDEPAQGAFFGLTLLPMAVWFVFSAFCVLLVIDYRLLMNSSVIALLVFAALGTVAYVLALELRMQMLLRLKASFSWKRIWIPLGLFALSLGYGAFVGFLDAMHWKAVICGALVLGCCLWNFQLFAVSWKNIAGTLAWIGTLIVFWCAFAFAYAPLLIGGSLKEMSSGWIRSNGIPFGHELYQWFHLSTAAGSFCFLALGILLLAAGYLLFGSLLADYAKLPLRKLFNGKIRCIWGIAAASYALFLVLALWESAAYHRATKELEAHFGRPLTSAELERQFYEGRAANSAFWEQLEAADHEYYNSMSEQENEYLYHPDAIFPEAIQARHKKFFLENAARQKLEQMLTAPIPPPKRDYADDQMLVAMPSSDLAMCRELARMNRQRILFALEDGEFDVVSASLDRMDSLREYLWKDHLYIAYLVGIAVEAIRQSALEKILASGLPPDEWLSAQAAKLAEVERQTELQEERFLFGESVSILNIFHWLAYYSGANTSLPAGLHYHSLRFLFPQAWWLTANEIKGLARMLCVHHFSELPTSRSGNILADMLLPAFSRGSEKMKSTIASCRVLRGLIQAEQIKRRTGEYPDSIDGLPQDPFSEQPLKYTKGACEIVEEIYQEEKNEEKSGENDEILYISEPSSKYVPQKRTLQAVQIWSVGPDGVNDGGSGHDNGKDDIRFIIPIRFVSQ